MAENEVIGSGIGPAPAAPGGPVVENAPGAVQSQSFEEWLDEIAGAPLAPSWPRTDADVEKALEWRGEAEAEIAAIRERLKAHVEAVTARAEQLIARQERRFYGLTSRLEQFATTHRSEIVRGKVKSKAYLTGSLGFRSTAERLEVVNKGELVAWLETLPPGTSLVRVKVEPEMKALQSHFKATGEIPPGCEHKPAHEKVHVESINLPSLIVKE
jgi:phage host-nuclease inhibitor protein Gam